jgi:hypothetical protein
MSKEERRNELNDPSGSVGVCSSCGRGNSPCVETVRCMEYDVPLYECQWCKAIETKRRNQSSQNRDVIGG